MTVTTMGKTKLIITADDKGFSIEVFGRKNIRRGRILRWDRTVKSGVVHYIDLPLSNDEGKYDGNIKLIFRLVALTH